MENTNPNLILDACSKLISSFKHDEFIVAFSGGEDSSVLLHAMVELKKVKKFNLRTIHINHNIQDNSAEVSEHCLRVSKNYSIKHSSYNVEIDNSSNIEEKCRIQRYNALRKHSNEGEIILTAHHLDDQIETFFLRMLRGSGIRGLSSMDMCTTLHERIVARPFLRVPKHELQNYSKNNMISYIDDQSNNDTRLDRNYIRHNIIPELKKKWVSLDKIISNNLDILSIQSDVLESYIESISTAYTSGDETVLEINKIIHKDYGVKVLLLHHWIYKITSTNLNLRHINEILKIMNTNNDSNPLFVFDNVKITKNGTKLIIQKP
tara:strand:- start:23 stop:985 length:963 start_codon:yes stop_codon:yes gene_type:complete